MAGDCDIIGAMPGRLRGDQRRSQPTVAFVAMYAVVMLASGFLHHDFACHRNSPTHCTSCLTNQSAQKVDVSAAPLDAIDRLIGKVELRSAFVVDRPLLTSVSDRAPPA